MSKKIEVVEVIPSAWRLVTSLRDLGYNFVTAVADIVDNSIEADATEVRIDVEFEGDQSWVRIADNGKGMTSEKLIEGMRFGTERDYDPDALGKFGLGLKTASLSQCEKLTVASRWNPQRADIAAFSWDINHLKESKKWEIIRVPSTELDIEIRNWLKKAPGTIVLWEKLHRILGCSNPEGVVACRHISAMCRELEKHLAMVFHRFLSGEIRGYQLKLFLNGNEIKPWDPFTRHETKTIRRNPIHIPLEHDGISGEVLLEPYILPPKEEFSSREAWERASGPRKWNLQQGFYIYRGGRLIQGGGWSRLRTMDEHTKLARVAMSFSPLLDEAFKINVVKMRVELPVEIRDRLENEVEIVVKAAREKYDRSSTPRPPIITSILSVTDSTRPRPLQGNTSPSGTIPLTIPDPLTTSVPDCSVSIMNPPSINGHLWSLDEIQAKLVELADSDERQVIEKVFIRFRQSFDTGRT